MNNTEKNGTWYAQASESEQTEFRDWLITLLQERTVQVQFKKSDGTVRVMKATLDPAVAVITESKTDRVKKPNPEVCGVWDLEAAGWRSFRFDRVEEILFNLE